MTTVPHPPSSYTFGPGYYAVLEIPRDASNNAIRSAHQRLKAKLSTAELIYEDPTEADEAAKEARIKELETAVSTLSNPAARYKHDIKHQIWDASWTVQRYQSLAGLLPAPPSPPPTVLYLDSWVPARDGRFTSNGIVWATPPTRQEYDAERRLQIDSYRPDQANASHSQSHAFVPHGSC